MERFPLSMDDSRKRYKDIIEQFQQATYSSANFNSMEDIEDEVNEPRSASSMQIINPRVAAMDAGAGDYSVSSGLYSSSLPSMYETQPLNRFARGFASDDVDNSENEEYKEDNFQSWRHTKVPSARFSSALKTVDSEEDIQPKTSRTALKSGKEISSASPISPMEPTTQMEEPKTFQIGDDAYDMNFLMLFGLVIGVLVGKGFKYMQHYFAGCQFKVHQLRLMICGDCGLVQLLQTNNVSQPLVRKLFLVPIYLICTFLIAALYVINSLMGLLLAKVPGTCIDSLNNWSN